MTLKRTAFLRCPPAADYAGVQVKRAEPKPAKGPRPKTCATCKERFTPSNTMARVCSPDCAVLLVVAERKAKKAKQDREDRAKTRATRRARSACLVSATVTLAPPCFATPTTSWTARHGPESAGHASDVRLQRLL